MGAINIKHTGSGSDISLSSDGTSLLLDGTAIGGGGGDPDLYRDNASSATTPTASGTNSLAIGNTAVASGENSFAIGSDTDATGLNSLALGKGAQAVSTRCIAMGLNASAQADRSIAIGNNGNVANATYATAIGSGSVGSGSEAHGSGSVALSNSRTGGADSLAAVIADNTSSYGASGSNSIAMGYQAKVTTNYGVAIGWKAKCTAGDIATAVGPNSTASGWYSTVIGGLGGSATQNYASALGGQGSQATGSSSTVAGGYSNTASGSYSIVTGGRGNTAGYNYTRAGGYEAHSGFRWGKDVWASGEFSSAGDAQTGKMVLRCDTTDATATALTSDNSSTSTINQVILPDNSAYAFHGTIVARQQAADGTACAAWKVEGLIRREGSAGTTVLVNSATTVLDNTPNWGMALSADTTNGGLAITCTGAASTDIRWVATIHTSEVTYA